VFSYLHLAMQMFKMLQGILIYHRVYIKTILFDHKNAKYFLFSWI